jgi:CRP/FNR family transcriptional regulator, nitrogen fixation regulation protein
MKEIAMLTAAHAPAKSQSAGQAVRTGALASSFAQLGVPMLYARDSEIFGEGEEAEYVYQVVSGAVRTYTILNDGRRQIAAFYLPGDIFGLEIGAAHELSAEAVCNCTVALIKRSSLTGLADRDSGIAQGLWGVTARELKRARRHMLLLVRTAQERVASFLLEMADRTKGVGSVDLPMPRRDIADYLGLTIETVSRTLTQLEGQAAIALPSARRVQLTNVRELRRLDS